MMGRGVHICATPICLLIPLGVFTLGHKSAAEPYAGPQTTAGISTKKSLMFHFQVTVPRNKGNKSMALLATETQRKRRLLADNSLEIISASLSCGVGYEPVEGECKPCQEGYFKILADNSSCLSCPPNSKASSVTQATTPSGSWLHYCWCLAGYVHVSNSSEDTTFECVPCQAGTYKNTASTESCLPCTSDSHSPAGSTEVACVLSCSSATRMDIIPAPLP